MRNRFFFVVLPIAWVCFSRGNQVESIKSLLFAIFSTLVVIALKMDHVEEKKKGTDWIRLLTIVGFVGISIDAYLGMHREFWIIAIPIICIMHFIIDIISESTKERKE